MNSADTTDEVLHIRHRAALVTAWLMLLAVFVVDRFLRAGIAVWLFYIFPLLITGWLFSQWAAFSVAVLCSGLIVLGQLLSPPEPEMQVALTNGLLGTSVLWIMFGLVGQVKRA